MPAALTPDVTAEHTLGMSPLLATQQKDSIIIERHAHSGTIRALGQVDPFHAQIVLRQKIVKGDDDPEVIARCLSSLLKEAGGRRADLRTGMPQRG